MSLPAGPGGALGRVWLGGPGEPQPDLGPLQKCTEYWPEEQVVHDGVEITVRKVIHTEDYRLRLISLRVRPGAGRGWEDGGKGTVEDITENSVPESTVAEVKPCVFQDLLMSRDEGGVNGHGAQSRTKPQLYFMLLGSLCVCTAIHKCLPAPKSRTVWIRGLQLPPGLSL